jgi:3-methylcrotonyl-CoA carboxylase beta subunit
MCIASKNNQMISDDFVIIYFCCRVSGVTDHYAHNDEHALSIARSIVANLNRQPSLVPGSLPFEEPLYPMDDIYSVIPSDPKKSFDVRKVSFR